MSFRKNLKNENTIYFCALFFNFFFVKKKQNFLFNNIIYHKCWIETFCNEIENFTYLLSFILYFFVFCFFQSLFMINCLTIQQSFFIYFYIYLLFLFIFFFCYFFSFFIYSSFQKELLSLFFEKFAYCYSDVLFLFLPIKR